MEPLEQNRVWPWHFNLSCGLLPVVLSKLVTGGDGSSEKFKTALYHLFPSVIFQGHGLILSQHYLSGIQLKNWDLLFVGKKKIKKKKITGWINQLFPSDLSWYSITSRIQQTWVPLQQLLVYSFLICTAFETLLICVPCKYFITGLWERGVSLK